MESQTRNTRLCPYCKEEILDGAIKCKHCQSFIRPQKPDHGGICPYCKEEIKPEAIKCKHCKSFLMERKSSLPRSTDFPSMSDPCRD